MSGGGFQMAPTFIEPDSLPLNPGVASPPHVSPHGTGNAASSAASPKTDLSDSPAFQEQSLPSHCPFVQSRISSSQRRTIARATIAVFAFWSQSNNYDDPPPPPEPHEQSMFLLLQPRQRKGEWRTAPGRPGRVPWIMQSETRPRGERRADVRIWNNVIIYMSQVYMSHCICHSMHICHIHGMWACWFCMYMSHVYMSHCICHSMHICHIHGMWAACSVYVTRLHVTLSHFICHSMHTCHIHGMWAADSVNATRLCVTFYVSHCKCQSMHICHTHGICAADEGQS